MPTPPKSGKLLYHLTSFENLEKILKFGLLSRNDAKAFDDVADQKIIDHRELHNLNSLVPFHFMTKSPFAGVVQKKNADKNFIYITVTRSIAKKLDYKVIVKHPLSLPKIKLHDYEAGIEAIDWDLMTLREYKNVECRHTCLAECLSPNTVKPSDFHSIFCKDKNTEIHVKQRSMEILGNVPFHVNTNVHFFI
jgi:hypothetical protein